MASDDTIDMTTRKATMIDIAAASGVSKSTVSLVLQGSPTVKAETRERVLATAERLGYVYNRGAARLRSARSNIVGMVINDLANPFFAELAVGIERVLQTAGFVPFLANTAENPRRQADVLKSMREHDIAGLIVCPARGTRAADLEPLVGRVPLLLAMRRVPGLRISTVVPDNHRGARHATEHLIALGHRRIAFIGGHSDMTAQVERAGGFRAALDTAGLRLDPTLALEGPTTRETGANAIDRLLERADPPTAALCFNDVVAFGAMDRLSRRGLTVGRDMAIVGFDDVREAAHVRPPLTTVAVDTQALGERAAHAVLRMIHGDGRIEEAVGEVDLVVRESCGARRATATAKETTGSE